MYHRRSVNNVIVCYEYFLMNVAPPFPLLKLPRDPGGAGEPPCFAGGALFAGLPGMAGLARLAVMGRCAVRVKNGGLEMERAALRIALVLVLAVTLACAARSGVRAPSAGQPGARPIVRALGLSGTLEGDFADPFILRAAGAYHAFATGARHRHVQVARS